MKEHFVEYYIDYKEGSVFTATRSDPLQRMLPFFVESCGRVYSADRYFIRRDGLESYLLMLTTEGLGQINYHGERRLLEPGSAVVIDCRDYHEYGCTAGNIWNFYYAHFDARSLEGFQCLFERLNPVMLREPRLGENMLEEIYSRAIQSSETDYYRHSHLLSGLLTEMVCGQNQERPVVRTEINRLAEYIRIHFAEDLHIDDLAERAGYSRYYFIHLFREQFGVSPYRYLNRCRVRHGEFLLRSTDMAVAQIADKVGYSSPELFIRHFKTENGMTPGEYRKNRE